MGAGAGQRGLRARGWVSRDRGSAGTMGAGAGQRGPWATEWVGGDCGLWSRSPGLAGQQRHWDAGRASSPCLPTLGDKEVRVSGEFRLT